MNDKQIISIDPELSDILYLLSYVSNASLSNILFINSLQGNNTQFYQFLDKYKKNKVIFDLLLNTIVKKYIQTNNISLSIENIKKITFDKTVGIILEKY